MTHTQKPTEAARPTPSSLNISYAIAKQRIQDLHFHSVVELIERSRGEVAAPQALMIYSRVHGLNEQDAQALKNRVMVHMGQAANADIHHLPNTFVAIDGAVEWDIGASLVERIRKRVGGRRHHALREWIELHSGHVEIQLMRLHVECLRNVREAAGPDVRIQDLVRDYARGQGVRESLHDALYYGFLERLFAELPESGDGPLGVDAAVTAPSGTKRAPADATAAGPSSLKLRPA